MPLSNQIDELLLHWEQERSRGLVLNPEQLCQDHPELLADLRERIKAIESIQDTLGTPQAPSAQTSDEAGPRFAYLRPGVEPGILGRLGPFRILKQIGEGGMGCVFLAEDPVAQRRVALKVMKSSQTVDGKASARFLREARSAAALDHDNIVAVYQVGEDNGVAYIAMPFLQGRSLQAYLENGAPLPLDLIVQIGRETALGLAAAHQRGLLHRDIKPANLWMEDRPALSPGQPPTLRVKILDFGLAKSVDEPQVTQSGAVLGTPGYMSPEQVNAEPVDAHSDLFSLGCVLYRLAAGRPAFTGKNLTATLRAIVELEPTPAEQLNPLIPPSLARLLRCLLAKNPVDRPASAQAVAAALANLSDERAAPATTQWMNPESEHGARPARSRRRRLVLGTVVLLLLVACGVWAWLRGRDPEPGLRDGGVHPTSTGAQLHQRTAECVLGQGGGVAIGSRRGITFGIKEAGQLPTDPFVLCDAWLMDSEKLREEKLLPLARICYLRSLHMAGSSITDDGLRQFFPSDIRDLNLRRTAVGDETTALLAKATDLRFLDLSQTMITDDGCGFLRDLVRLRCLCLSLTKVGDKGLQHLADHRFLSHLEVGRSFTAAGLASLQRLPALRILVLSGSQVGDEGVEGICKLSQLALADLTKTTISAAGAERIQANLPAAIVVHPGLKPSKERRGALQWALENGRAACVGGRNGALKPLTLVPEEPVFLLDFTADASRRFSPRPTWIRALQGIRWVTWPGASDGEVESVSALTSVVLLNLNESPDLTDRGLERIGKMTGLDVLLLGNCTRVTDKGFRCLESNKSLHVLGLQGSRIGDEGLEMLGRLSDLGELRLDRCDRITSEGLRHLLDLSVLRLLWLNNTGIDNAAVKHLKCLKTLRLLNVVDTALTQQGITELQEALPKCAIFLNGGAVIPASEATGP